MSINKTNYKFFQNRDCEFFPCHKEIDIEDFNCLLCFCPLYLLKEECGGNFIYTASGIKDCEKCTLPHCGEKGYDQIMEKMDKVIALSKKNSIDIT